MAEQLTAFECRIAENYKTPPPIDIKNSTMRFALLNCQMSDRPGQPMGILLKKSSHTSQYFRNHPYFHLISPLRFDKHGKAEMEMIFVNPPRHLVTDSDICFLLCDSWCVIRTLPSPTHGFFPLETYPSNAWTLSNWVLFLELGSQTNISNPAVLLLEGSDGCLFAMLFQKRNRSFYANIVWCWGGEHAKDVLALYRKNLEPQDHVTYKISQKKVLSVNVRKCPGGHMAGILIYLDESPP